MGDEHQPNGAESEHHLNHQCDQEVAVRVPGGPAWKQQRFAFCEEVIEKRETAEHEADELVDDEVELQGASVAKNPRVFDADPLLVGVRENVLVDLSQEVVYL